MHAGHIGNDLSHHDDQQKLLVQAVMMTSYLCGMVCCCMYVACFTQVNQKLNAHTICLYDLSLQA